MSYLDPDPTSCPPHTPASPDRLFFYLYKVLSLYGQSSVLTLGQIQVRAGGRAAARRVWAGGRRCVQYAGLVVIHERSVHTEIYLTQFRPYPPPPLHTTHIRTPRTYAHTPDKPSTVPPPPPAHTCTAANIPDHAAFPHPHPTHCLQVNILPPVSPHACVCPLAPPLPSLLPPTFRCFRAALCATARSTSRTRSHAQLLSWAAASTRCPGLKP